MILSSFLDAAPILLLIVVGVVVRAARMVDDKSRIVLTRLAFHVTIPAAIFTSIARAQLSLAMLYQVLIGLGLPLILAGVGYLTTRRLTDRPDQRGVMLVSMVVLGIFGYPFMQLYYGDGGLARIAMYDVGNALYAGTAALWFARSFGQTARGGGSRPSPWESLVGLLASPILIAAVLGVLVSAAGVRLGGPVGNLFDRLAGANTPLAMIAVGVYIRPRAAHIGLVAQWVLIRMVLGGILGWAAALALGMHGVDVIVACTASALPAGTTTLVYAGNEGLDGEFAAAIISVSVILGAIMINVLPHLLASVYL